MSRVGWQLLTEQVLQGLAFLVLWFSLLQHGISCFLTTALIQQLLTFAL
jgi:hypothetical protein